MRRLLILPLVLLFAAPAGAKEVKSAEVCGTDRCVEVTGGSDGMVGGSETSAPTAPEDFVTLSVTFGERGHYDTIPLRFLPGSGLSLAGDGTWYQADTKSVEALRAAAAQVQLRPASRIADQFAAPEPPPAAPVPAQSTVPVDDADGINWALIAGLVGAALLVALAIVGVRRRPAAAP